MNRHYYISDNLKDLERVESELQALGINSPQLHVYSRDDISAEVDAHELHQVTDFSKRDVIHSGLTGLAIGTACATVLLIVVYLFDWNDSTIGWTPFIFLAAIILGFSTWEGGLRGIQEPNHEFAQFQHALDNGKHIFFIDIDPEQENILNQVASNHPQLEFAGDGSAAPGWLVHGQAHFQRFIKAMP